MSLYVEWVNQIKTKADHTWLTEAQRAVYESILTRWPKQRFVCLYGPSGCGKSFIARLLAREHDYAYVNDLQEAPDGSIRVVVDGAEYSRLMRPAADALKLERVVITMRTPPKDPMPKVGVALTERDVGQFQHNLVMHHVLQTFLTDAEGTNLGRILRAEAIQRSGIDGNE